VGLRFNNVSIPNGATIAGAYIQFTVDETSSGVTTLDLRGEAADNAATFTTTSFNISSRPRTIAAVTWSPEAWATLGEAGPAQRTVDISPVIQEIVNRPGWFSGSSLTIIITGTGTRIAESYNGSVASAPLLHVEYAYIPVPANDVAVSGVTAPTPVEVGQTQIVTVDVSNEGTVSETFPGEPDRQPGRGIRTAADGHESPPWRILDTELRLDVQCDGSAHPDSDGRDSDRRDRYSGQCGDGDRGSLR